MTATTSTKTERDALYFQGERERVVALHEMELDAARLAAELYQRLDHFDELDEAASIEAEGAPIRHRYTGHGLCWLQQRLGEARAVLATAARRLQESARELELAAGTTSRSGRVDHIARGYQALAGEAARVAESFAPWNEPVQTDWTRVDAICDGIRLLEDRQDAEFKAEIVHDLRSFDRNREGLLALGMHDYVASQIDGNPALQRALATMRTYVGEAPARQQAP
ncbi:hypothetical protein [Pseudoxanthomonas wuyuanensis]|uniref:Uncharacterized protein n=1 Tax=Pseudoxanthomonas wuyuanensis TaxID=1073196 RepID=A0A286CXW9_9GAMM|nr:hypothetical protein [Pseudoxanthomonas wuyuanensis]KAF1722649.1 hypothetical protein CSC75_02150 [Pseudoxanthomonas wuyuanensis]SOD51242.1 hypothetical protein SAMN06296416_101524 [Pseudoxanthomonas wuyuanensis]